MSKEEKVLNGLTLLELLAQIQADRDNAPPKKKNPFAKKDTSNKKPPTFTFWPNPNDPLGDLLETPRTPIDAPDNDPLNNAVEFTKKDSDYRNAILQYIQETKQVDDFLDNEKYPKIIKEAEEYLKANHKLTKSSSPKTVTTDRLSPIHPSNKTILPKISSGNTSLTKKPKSKNR